MKITELNLWVLRRHFNGAETAPNKLETTAVSHIRRCVDAGLVEVADRSTLRLTEAGKAAVR